MPVAGGVKKEKAPAPRPLTAARSGIKVVITLRVMTSSRGARGLQLRHPRHAPTRTLLLFFLLTIPSSLLPAPARPQGCSILVRREPEGYAALVAHQSHEPPTRGRRGENLTAQRAPAVGRAENLRSPWPGHRPRTRLDDGVRLVRGRSAARHPAGRGNAKKHEKTACRSLWLRSRSSAMLPQLLAAGRLSGSRSGDAGQAASACSRRNL